MPPSLLLFLLLFFFFFFSKSLAAPSSSEAEALLSLKSSWLDPSEKLQSWSSLSSFSLCTNWVGISCDRSSSHVIAINLPAHLRGGTISSSIASLPSLQLLDLSSNHLTGPIPSQISSLPHLQWLSLHSNSLNGSIPPQIGNLKLLKTLDLGYNQLSNQIPISIGNLSALRNLILRRNSLSGSIPVELSRLTALQYLQLEYNNLSGSIPAEIGQLRSLKYLAIESNSLSGSIPSSLGNLTQLVALYAGHNHLSGSVPDSLGNLSHLIRLDLQDNALVGQIPPSLGSLHRLKTLNLSSNGFNGTIPSSLSQFPNSSFLNNPHLCSIADSKCNSTSSPPSPVPPSLPKHAPPPFQTPPHNKHKHKKKNIIIGVVVGVGGLLVLLLLLFLYFFCFPKKGTTQIQGLNHPDAQANRQKAKMEMFVRNFKYNYNDIVSNAGFYDTAHVLGKGRFATVYRSTLPDGNQLAVKVFIYPNLSPNFEKDIELLGMVKHRNLLTIKGYYSNPAEKAIFYELMPNGSLYNLLHGQGQAMDRLPDWSTRQKIALGTAQALTYLHSGYNIRLVHKDVKSSNILLDAEMAPRVSDFGLVGVVTGSQTEGVLSIVETPGYAPPELGTTRRYSEKADVYGFGVVLLELVTGKKPVSIVGDRNVSLVNWVKRLHKEGRGKEMMDPKALATCPSPDFLDRALNLGILCLNDNPSQRPTMSEVAAILEGLGASSPLRSPELRIDRPLLF